MTLNDDIREAVKKKRVVIGTRSVIKNIKGGEISLVVYASNIPENFRRDLDHYAEVSKIEVKGIKEDSAHLGGLCGKPFNILTAGIRKQGDKVK